MFKFLKLAMSNKILDDHKRKGKIFQPPLLNVGTFVETAWIDYAVPEFIWILILITEYGVDKGSVLALEFACVADDYLISKIDNGSAAAIISSFYLLNASEKVEIIEKMKEKKLLAPLRHAFKYFDHIYPESPFSFLNEYSGSEKLKSGRSNLSKYKLMLNKFLDKTSYESSIVLANIANFLLTKERLFVTQESNLPALKEILDYPNTENSKRIASFLRSSVNMCFNPDVYNRGNFWITYFWNQNYEIEPIQL